MMSTGSATSGAARGLGVKVIPGNLAGIDAVDDESIVVFCWQEARPLQGVAGYLDWRTLGALSELAISGSFEGRLGEVTLMAADGRLGHRRLFIFGLGAAAQWRDLNYGDIAMEALRVVQRAGASTVLLAAPSVARTLDPDCALEYRFACAVDETLGQPGNRDWRSLMRAILVEHTDFSAS